MAVAEAVVAALTAPRRRACGELHRPPFRFAAIGYWAVSHSATPPWLEQVPEWCFDFEYVPSLHFAVAPVGSVLPAVAVGADFEAVDDFAAAGAAAAGAAAGAGAAAVAAAGLFFDAF